MKKTAAELLELYYHDVRSHLLETAAAFDRIERASAGAPPDPRLAKLRLIAGIACDKQPERARRVLEALSDE
ncbi:MAG: hypothetical protein GX902_08875 [Lentisphaerae bacterium]|jgi:hypothetical protein|nr:hypothetical protein [Lentisphaerota bacterium]